MGRGNDYIKPKGSKALGMKPCCTPGNKPPADKTDDCRAGNSPQGACYTGKTPNPGPWDAKS